MTKEFLPEAATENHMVVFGMTGAGKSSVIISAIAPICCITSLRGIAP